MDPEALPDDGSSAEVGRLWKLVGTVIVVAAVVGIVWLSIAMLPEHSPPLGRNPSWLDYIVDNRWVIWLIRLSGIAVGAMFTVFAIYFIRSIAHRIRSGHWLRSGGPFQAEIVERAEHALEDVEPLFEALTEAEQRNIELDDALNDTNALLEQLSGLLQEAQLENDRLQNENDWLRARLDDEDPSQEG